MNANIAHTLNRPHWSSVHVSVSVIYGDRCAAHSEVSWHSCHSRMRHLALQEGAAESRNEPVAEQDHLSRISWLEGSCCHQVFPLCKGMHHTQQHYRLANMADLFLAIPGCTVPCSQPKCTRVTGSTGNHLCNNEAFILMDHPPT